MRNLVLACGTIFIVLLLMSIPIITGVVYALHADFSLKFIMTMFTVFEALTLGDGLFGTFKENKEDEEDEGDTL